MKVIGTKKLAVGFVTADNTDDLQSALFSRMATTVKNAATRGATASEIDLQFRMVAMPDGTVRYGVMTVLAWCGFEDDEDERDEEERS